MYKKPMLVEYFLDNLRILMKEMPQIDLANGAGVSRSNIANWFSRKTLPNPEDIERLAVYFQVKPHYFFMEPGTQGEAKPIEREDAFKAFLDELAGKHLSEKDLAAYHHFGGASTFVVTMKRNFEETGYLGFPDWYQILAKKLTEYSSLNILEKVRREMNEKHGVNVPVKKNEVS